MVPVHKRDTLTGAGRTQCYGMYYTQMHVQGEAHAADVEGSKGKDREMPKHVQVREA